MAGPGEEVSVGGNRVSASARGLTIETLWFRRDILGPHNQVQPGGKTAGIMIAIVAQLSGAGYSLGKYHPPLRVIVVIRT